MAKMLIELVCIVQAFFIGCCTNLFENGCRVEQVLNGFLIIHNCRLNVLVIKPLLDRTQNRVYKTIQPYKPCRQYLSKADIGRFRLNVS